MGSGGSENFKMLPLRIAAKSFQTCPEVPPDVSHKRTLEFVKLLM